MKSLPFATFNTNSRLSPVVVAVPHAGRAYPPSMPKLRVPIDKLVALEDRFADRLADGVVAAGIVTLVAATPRLWIDLNRAESELDPSMVRGKLPSGAPLPPRVRAGLGLIPRRLGSIGELWGAPLDPEDVESRIVGHHRPWHETLASLLADARTDFGAALLIDLHSMPPIDGPDAPDIVIGDRFGRSASPQLTAAAEAIAVGAGFRVAINTPYAGGYALDRHARPHRGLHALQIEFDRRTYLDAAFDQTGSGLARMQALVSELVTRLGDELVPPRRLAAE